MGKNILSLSAASFAYTADKWIFHDLSFQLKYGETMAILGLNGRGKTTLLQTLTANLPLTKGHITLNGYAGYVPQSFNPPFSYSAFDIVLMGRARHLSLFRSPTKNDIQIAKQALEMLEISELANSEFGQLSGGQRQMVLIARAMAMQSQLLIMDEPAAALDFYNQSKIFSLINKMATSHKLSVIFTTHQPNHVFAVADKVLLMRDDLRYCFGSPDELLTPENLHRLYGIPMKRVAINHNGTLLESIIPVYQSQIEHQQPQ